MLGNTDLDGWKKPYKKLAKQMRDYNAWVKAEILPRARDDYRLPPVMYEDALQNWGVDASPEALIQNATQGYMDIRNEMEASHRWSPSRKAIEVTDYREVIRR